MFIRLLLALVLALPTVAVAQTVPNVTTVEILATGEIDAPASYYTVKFEWTAKGEDEAAARRAQSAKQAEVRAALSRAGLAPADVTLTAGTTYTSAPDFESMSNAMVVDAEDTVDANAIDAPAYQDPEMVTSVSDSASVRATSLAQVEAIRAALSPLDISVGAPTPALDNPEAVTREVKMKALANARADAEAYGRALGLRVVRVVRISETGDNLFLPGLQAMAQRAMLAGPQAMQSLFESKPGFVHVETAIIVEFELAP